MSDFFCNKILNILETSELDEQPIENVDTDNVSGILIEKNSGIIAIYAEVFDGSPNSFFLCTKENNKYQPIDRQPIYFDDKDVSMKSDLK